LPDSDPDAAWAKLAPLLSAVIECTWSADGAPLEIVAPGVSKASALARVCEPWGAQPEDVVAVGDAVNDLPMLAWAGVSVAVANANPAVLALATRHTASNDDDGVAIVIEELLSAQ